MRECLFQLPPAGKMSLQSQIREVLVSAILGGQLPVEVRIPSSRYMARQLGVTRNTVVLAYQGIIDDGYIVARERSGYYVNEEILNGRAECTAVITPSEFSSPDWKARFRVQPGKQENIHKPANWQDYPYPFIYGQVDHKLFPIAEWRECNRQALGKQWIEEPGYPDMRNIFQLRTSRVMPVPVDHQGLIVDDRLALTDLIFTTPSHQFPTTVTMPRERRKQLLDAARAHDFVVVEDDYEFETNYIGEPCPALKSLDGEGRVVYVGSLSKTLFPGLRMGFLVWPKELVGELRELRRLMVRHAPSNNQRAAALFLSLGYHDALISRLERAYKMRWEEMRNALAAHLPNSSRMPTFGGSSYWVTGPEGLDNDALSQEALEAGIIIEPGRIYFVGEQTPSRYFHLGFSSIDSRQIAPGIKLLAELIEAHMRRKSGAKLQ